MITIPTASLVMLAAGLFVTAIFVIGLLAYWKGRIYRAEAEVLRKDAERDKKCAIDERNKAELILEEAKRHGYRPERRPASGKWGRLGYSEGPVKEDGPVGPAGPIGPPGWSSFTGCTGPFGSSGPTGPHGPSGSGRSESDVLKEMLELQNKTHRECSDMEGRMIALFKEIMTTKPDRKIY